MGQIYVASVCLIFMWAGSKWFMEGGESRGSKCRITNICPGPLFSLSLAIFENFSWISLNWKKETTIQSNRLRVRLDFQVPGETRKMAVNCFWRNKSQDIQRKHWIKIHRFAFTNGITCRGLFPLFVPIRATFAAVSNSPLAQSASLDRAGSQGFKLETLGYYLPDPGAATSQEHQCKGWRGQISRD